MQAVWPCLFKIVDEGCIFNKKDPYILGVDVLEGTLRLGCPVVIPSVKWTGDSKTQVAHHTNSCDPPTSTFFVVPSQVEFFDGLNNPRCVPWCTGSRQPLPPQRPPSFPTRCWRTGTHPLNFEGRRGEQCFIWTRNGGSLNHQCSCVLWLGWNRRSQRTLRTPEAALDPTVHNTVGTSRVVVGMLFGHGDSHAFTLMGSRRFRRIRWSLGW